LLSAATNSSRNFGAHDGTESLPSPTAKRDKAAALKPIKRVLKWYGEPRSVVIDGFCSYSAVNEIGVADRHEVGARLSNRAEYSHQTFRRRERAMQWFRRMKTL
jgi:putative transposase